MTVKLQIIWMTMHKTRFNSRDSMSILILVCINHMFDSAFASIITRPIPTLNTIPICTFFAHPPAGVLGKFPLQSSINTCL